MAVYERRKDGVYVDGQRRFIRPIYAGLYGRKPIPGTEWSVFSKSDGGFEDGPPIKLHLRISNSDRGTDVVQLDLVGQRCRFRFYSLADPILKISVGGMALYDGRSLVAEHVRLWQESEQRAGNVDRVSTYLDHSVADAAAILLFLLADYNKPAIPAISTLDAEEVPPWWPRSIEKVLRWSRRVLRLTSPIPREHLQPLGF